MTETPMNTAEKFRNFVMVNVPEQPFQVPSFAELLGECAVAYVDQLWGTGFKAEKEGPCMYFLFKDESACRVIRPDALYRDGSKEKPCAISMDIFETHGLGEILAKALRATDDRHLKRGSK